ncbi:MAG: MDR family MFS transporter [Janthinobacterium lividum]
MAPAAMAPPGAAAPASPMAVTVVVMMATFITVLDSTIANVALPHMQASLGAASDTVTWVLTSYIVAAAIATPLTGFLGGKFGRKPLFLAAIAGFVLASMLCGLAQSLNQMVLFRMLQGASGAFIVPLGQSFLLDAYPKEKHGQAMALWGVGVMVGPVMGPVLGGWLTDSFEWRWVFYVNLPFGLLALFGAISVLPTTANIRRRFDAFGFVAAGIGIAALQLMLDRGQQLDWFSSWEIRIEAAACAMGLWVFFVHILTGHDTILDKSMLRDRNIATGFVFIFLIGILTVATTALIPPMLETLYNYPVVTTGIVLAPRGVGTMFSMFLVGRLIGRVDARLLILSGLTLTALAMWMMSGFSPEMGVQPILVTGLIQGVGVGLLFVPLNTLAFATVLPEHRTDAASFFSLLRNLGGSVGVSLVVTVLAQQVQVSHSDLGGSLTAAALGADPSVLAALGATGDAVMMMLDQAVNGQAAMIGYLDDFRLLMWVTIASMPLIALLKVPRKVEVDPAHMAME